MMQRYNIFLNYLSYFPNILFITKKALGIFVRYFRKPQKPGKVP
jgi:hypothetical protein